MSFVIKFKLKGLFIKQWFCNNVRKLFFRKGKSFHLKY